MPASRCPDPNEPAAGTGPILASVIIPVHNGAGTLVPCLNALAAQTAAPGTWEVIVVDDGSTDGSADVAKRHRSHPTIARQQHLGAAAARNVGARLARGMLLLFTDADCEPMPDWISQITAPFSDESVAGAKGVYRTRQRSLVARFAQAELEEKYDRLQRGPTIDFIDTYSAAYRRDVFEAHGGFDPAFMLDEDQELSFRLASAGHRLVFVPGAAVYHQHPASIWPYALRKARLGRWKVAVHLRHPAKALSDSYTPNSQKTQIALLPLLLASALASVLGSLPGYLPASLAALGLLTSMPLAFRAARHGWTVGAVAPLLVMLRAGALALGITHGLLHLLSTTGHPGRFATSASPEETS